MSHVCVLLLSWSHGVLSLDQHEDYKQRETSCFTLTATPPLSSNISFSYTDNINSIQFKSFQLEIPAELCIYWRWIEWSDNICRYTAKGV